MTAKELCNQISSKITWDELVKPEYVQYTDADITATRALSECWIGDDDCVSNAYSANKVFEQNYLGRWRTSSTEHDTADTKKINKKESNTMKNVLFLAPGYAYARSVIINQGKELDRKKIAYNASADYDNLYITTDKVKIEFICIDPIKWTSNLFKNRDAVFGKKELIRKAEDTLTDVYIKRPTMSLSAYISKMHAQDTVEIVEPLKTYIPEIKNVYFNNPMTVVMWEDGTKTMVKCQDGDAYSAESGLALCIAKKALGNMPNFNNVFKKWISEVKE